MSAEKWHDNTTVEGESMSSLIVRALEKPENVVPPRQSEPDPEPLPLLSPEDVLNNDETFAALLRAIEGTAIAERLNTVAPRVRQSESSEPRNALDPFVAEGKVSAPSPIEKTNGHHSSPVAAEPRPEIAEPTPEIAPAPEAVIPALPQVAAPPIAEPQIPSHAEPVKIDAGIPQPKIAPKIAATIAEPVEFTPQLAPRIAVPEPPASPPPFAPPLTETIISAPHEEVPHIQQLGLFRSIERPPADVLPSSPTHAAASPLPTLPAATTSSREIPRAIAPPPAAPEITSPAPPIAPQAAISDALASPPASSTSAVPLTVPPPNARQVSPPVPKTEAAVAEKTKPAASPAPPSLVEDRSAASPFIARLEGERRRPGPINDTVIRKKGRLSTWLRNWFSADPVVDPRRGRRLLNPPLVAFYWTGGTPKPHTIADISTRGIYLISKERWIPGTRVSMTLQRTDRDSGSPESWIAVDVKVVRWGRDGLGGAFIPAMTGLGHTAARRVEERADRSDLDRFVKHLDISSQV
jgi:hypothetical protein